MFFRCAVTLTMVYNTIPYQTRRVVTKNDEVGRGRRPAVRKFQHVVFKENNHDNNNNNNNNSDHKQFL